MRTKSTEIRGWGRAYVLEGRTVLMWLLLICWEISDSVSATSTRSPVLVTKTPLQDYSCLWNTWRAVKRPPTRSLVVSLNQESATPAFSLSQVFPSFLCSRTIQGCISLIRRPLINRDPLDRKIQSSTSWSRNNISPIIHAMKGCRVRTKWRSLSLSTLVWTSSIRVRVSTILTDTGTTYSSVAYATTLNVSENTYTCY